MRYVPGVLLAVALALLALGAAKHLLSPRISLQAATLSSPSAQSYLVIFGVGEKVAAKWDGSIAATGAAILSLQGWRLDNADSISGTTSWRLSARPSPPGPGANAGPIQENGIIVTIATPATAAVTFDVKTMQGNFSFSTKDVAFGATKSFLAPAGISRRPCGTPRDPACINRAPASRSIAT